MPPKKDGKKKKGKGPEFTVDDIEAFVKVHIRVVYLNSSANHSGGMWKFPGFQLCSRPTLFHLRLLILFFLIFLCYCGSMHEWLALACADVQKVLARV